MFFNSNLLTILKLLLEGEKQIMKKKKKKINKLLLCLVLYRKDVIDNFYYVYINPRKTTLVNKTDFAFVLSGQKILKAYMIRIYLI